MDSIAQENNKIMYKGVITYERKVNLKKIMLENGDNNSWTENLLKTMPDEMKTNFELSFNMNSSLYKKSDKQVIQEKIPGWLSSMASDDEVYDNFETKKTVFQKNILDKSFLINDSLIKIPWKITNEFRRIAGFNCRKATAILMDSIYVIAFYTDAIYPPTGPELMHGLPGAILGLIYPRLHVMYLASKVEPIMIKDESITPPTKGTKSTFPGLTQSLKDVGKNWGASYEDKMQWRLLY